MHAGILQNPTDPDATFREKPRKEHRGYVANVVEEKCENGSIVTDCHLEQNTCSDSRFMQDYVEEIGPREDPITIVADGADVEEKAAENNVTDVNTNYIREG